MSLKGKNVFITGAGSGIGKAAAVKFAKEGANLAILGLTEKKLEATRQEVQAICSQCLVFSADVSNHHRMEAVFKELSKDWNKIDVVFANAGINGLWAPIEEITPEEWDYTHSINMKGTFLTVKYALPFMKEKGGSIIIDSSTCGTRSFVKKGISCYASSKAAQESFGKVAALELAEYKIRVNVICPGATISDIDSRMQNRGNDKLLKWVEYPNGIPPLTRGNWATAEQVADAVIFFADDTSSHITGSVLHIDGGSSLL